MLNHNPVSEISGVLSQVVQGMLLKSLCPLDNQLTQMIIFLKELFVLRLQLISNNAIAK